MQNGIEPGGLALVGRLFKRIKPPTMIEGDGAHVERQVVALHVRVALRNRFTQLGRPTTVSVAAMA
jgi:hypothetical protein